MRLLINQTHCCIAGDEKVGCGGKLDETREGRDGNRSDQELMLNIVIVIIVHFHSRSSSQGRDTTRSSAHVTHVQTLLVTKPYHVQKPCLF